MEPSVSINMYVWLNVLLFNGPITTAAPGCLGITTVACVLFLRVVCHPLRSPIDVEAECGAFTLHGV